MLASIHSPCSRSCRTEVITSCSFRKASPLLAAPKQRYLCTRALRKAHKTTSAAAVPAVGTAEGRLPRWEYIFDKLNEGGVKTIKAEEAAELMKKGYVLIDVRPKDLYEKAHPEGAKNAALFRNFELGKTSFTGLLRATALALNGVSPVEPNPEFIEELTAAAGKGSKIILACEAGGSLVPNASFQYGKESRSLKAAYKALVSDNFAEVLHLGGGVYGWYKADLPFVGEYDLANVGRTPNVVSNDD